jgi:hypothetical protein
MFAGLVTTNGVTAAAIMIEDAEVAAETNCRLVPRMA